MDKKNYALVCIISLFLADMTISDVEDSQRPKNIY